MNEKKILIIDDEPLVRRSLRRAFEIKKYSVIEATDGSIGLEIWQNEKPDIVFLDVLMPGLSGPEVLQSVPSSIRTQSFVILMSAYSGSYDVESAKSLGADYFFAKPFEDIFKLVDQTEQLVRLRI